MTTDGDQLEFAIFGQLFDAPVKDAQALMANPFLALTNRHKSEAFEYTSKDGRDWLRVVPSEKGMATVHDKDLLIYVGSILRREIERGRKISRIVEFHPYDFLKATGRATNKQGYDSFIDMLDRLDGTRIRTNIDGDIVAQRKGFGLIAEYELHSRKTKSGKTVMSHCSVTLGKWMFEAFEDKRRIATINPDYFTLKHGLDRALISLCRKHIGSRQGSRPWGIRVDNLAKKIGWRRELWQFRDQLKKRLKASGNKILDYRLELRHPDDHKRMTLWFFQEGKLEYLHEPALLTGPASPDEVPDPSEYCLTMVAGMCDGWDINFLLDQWKNFAVKKGEEINDCDKAFEGFALWYTANHSL
jgi:hypothetical protein